jgi:predicted extracellular nuclease
MISFRQHPEDVLRPSLPRVGLAVTTATAVTFAVAMPAAAIAAPSQDALIAEVYGGGGNSGATLTNDFVELANRGTAPVSIDGWSVQYLSANPTATSKWQATPLTGSIPAGGRYLVAEAKGAGGTVSLPAPDATGGIAMAGAAGAVALVTGSAPLTCITAADCAADPRVRDLIGYGTAVVREGNAAPAASNTNSAARKADLADTDDNATDFAAGAPTPVNSKGETPGGGDPGPDPDPNPQPGDKRIHDIQGTTRISPLAGQKVTNVPGVVTGVRATGSRGFWIQDDQPDTDARTSEGVFVFTGSATPTVEQGDSVLVSATVAEFRAGGDAGANQTLTELTGPQVTALSKGNALPEAEVIGPDSVPNTMSPSANGGSVEPLALDPAAYALDFWEAREGMRLRVDDARIVGATNNFGDTWITTKSEQNKSARGGTVYLGYDQPNTGRLKLVSSGTQVPASDVGDVLKGSTIGALDYSSFGGFTLAVSAVGQHVPGGITPEVTRAARQSELSVGTYNVENLSPTDAQAKFDRLGAAVVHNLSSPDVVALEEIQDNSGATDDGTVAADVTLQKFTDAIVTAGGPRYEWRQIDPANKVDGGAPGGNIRVAFIFNPARVSFVDRPGGTTTTPVSVVDEHGRAALSVSPGRVDPANPAWDSSRKPLAGEFKFRGRTVFVVANHFNSKGGDQPMHGRYQPPNRSSEIQRQQQAATLRAFVDQIQKIDAGANIVLAGDINDYQFSPAVGTLTAGGAVTDLINTLPVAERYSYVFEGNSQVLDHIFLSRNINRFDYDVVHINSEFASQASDHDPQVVRVRPSTGNASVDRVVFQIEDALDRIQQQQQG